MSNNDCIVSSNQGVVENDDGWFIVALGGPDCRDLAPKHAFKPLVGWNRLLRAYLPYVAAFRAYEMPEI